MRFADQIDPARAEVERVRAMVPPLGARSFAETLILRAAEDRLAAEV